MHVEQKKFTASAPQTCRNAIIQQYARIVTYSPDLLCWNSGIQEGGEKRRTRRGRKTPPDNPPRGWPRPHLRSRTRMTNKYRATTCIGYWLPEQSKCSHLKYQGPGRSRPLPHLDQFVKLSRDERRKSDVRRMNPLSRQHVSRSRGGSRLLLCSGGAAFGNSGN